MLILLLALLFKFYLFTSLTQVEHNRFLVILFSFLLSSLLIFLIDSLARDRKKSWSWMLGFYSLISIIMLVDSMHFAYFSALPSVRMLGQAGQVGDVLDSLFGLLSWKSLALVLDIPFLIYIGRKLEFSFSLRIFRRPLRYGLIFLNFALIGGFLFFASPDLRASLGQQELYSFHFNDIRSAFLGEEDIDSPSRYRQEVLDRIWERTEFVEGELTGLGKGKNLIVIQVEALQNFVIGLDYNGQEITPNLNKLARDQSSIYYDNYFQSTGRGNTSDAEFVSNNSLHPSMETPSYEQYEDNTFYGLPWILKEEGYRSWVFHGYERDFWNRDRAYVGQGFERFVAEDDYDFSKEDVIGLGISDEEFFNQSLDYLEEMEEMGDPFYAFLITLTSHNPYKMPREYHSLDILPDHKGTLVGNYLQSIHYTDRCIGEFIEGLKERGLYEDSLLALYGDHFAIQPGDEEARDIMTEILGVDYGNDHVMNIPLIIHLPGEDIHRVESRVGSQLDFMPTILNIMGYENEKTPMFGVDLNNYKGENLVRPQTILRKGSFIGEDFLFEIARTQIFDQSRALDRETREELDIAPFRKTYEEVLDEINLSDFILKNDLLGSFLKEGRSLNLDHLDGGRENLPTIYNRDFKSLEDLDALVSDGISPLRADAFFGDDGMIYINSLLFEDVLEDFEGDVEFFLDIDREFLPDFLNRLKFLYPEARSSYLISFEDFDDYFFITSYGFQRSILDLRDSPYKEGEVRDFLRTGDLYGVIVDSMDSDYLEVLREESLPIYMEDSRGDLILMD